MKKKVYLTSLILTTVVTFLYVKNTNRLNDVTSYAEIVKELSSMENEAKVLKTYYSQNTEALVQRGVINDLETLEDFAHNMDMQVKEVDLLKFIGNKEELIATVPTLYDAFSVKNCDMIRVTFSTNTDVSELLKSLSLQEVSYKEIKIIPLENKIQLTFLV